MVINPLTVQVTLTEPYYGLLSEFASLRASGVVPRGIAERENLKVQAVGTGPFKLVEYVPQDHLTYTRFDQYWDHPLPYLDELQFKVLTEEAARLSGLRSGQLQYAVLSPEGVRQVGGPRRSRCCRRHSRGPRRIASTSQENRSTMRGSAAPSGWRLIPGT